MTFRPNISARRLAALSWSIISAFQSIASPRALGKACVSNSTCFSANSGWRVNTPVILPPGDLRLFIAAFDRVVVVGIHDDRDIFGFRDRCFQANLASLYHNHFDLRIDDSVAAAEGKLTSSSIHLMIDRFSPSTKPCARSSAKKAS